MLIITSLTAQLQPPDDDDDMKDFEVDHPDDLLKKEDGQKHSFAKRYSATVWLLIRIAIFKLEKLKVVEDDPIAIDIAKLKKLHGEDVISTLISALNPVEDDGDDVEDNGDDVEDDGDAYDELMIFTDKEMELKKERLVADEHIYMEELATILSFLSPKDELPELPPKVETTEKRVLEQLGFF
jgi:hypothetical protein